MSPRSPICPPSHQVESSRNASQDLPVSVSGASFSSCPSFTRRSSFPPLPSVILLWFSLCLPLRTLPARSCHLDSGQNWGAASIDIAFQRLGSQFLSAHLLKLDAEATFLALPILGRAETTRCQRNELLTMPACSEPQVSLGQSLHSSLPTQSHPLPLRYQLPPLGISGSSRFRLRNPSLNIVPVTLPHIMVGLYKSPNNHRLLFVLRELQTQSRPPVIHTPDFETERSGVR